MASERSAIGDRVKEINDMVNNHLGEVREIDGAWVRQEGAVPLSKVFYNSQYAINRQQYMEWLAHQRARKAEQPALGGELQQLPDHTQDPEGRYCSLLAYQRGGGFKARTARVFALAELFWFWGHEFTARELYAYYVHARRLVLTKAHSTIGEERRAMVVAHHQTTSRWDMGRVGEGELVVD